MRPLKQNRRPNTCLFGRTHEPCVPTCIRAAFPINHFTHQYGQYKYVGTHGPCVHSSRIEGQIRVYLVGLTSRASLHAFAHLFPSIILRINTANKVCRDARSVRSLKQSRRLNTCLFVWTHEPCVPTCIRTARPINHFIHQYSHDGYVGTHGSCVRSVRNNQLVQLFTHQLPTET